MSVPTILFALYLTLLRACLAVHQCQAPATLYGISNPPAPSDCRRALAHMPLRDKDADQGPPLDRDRVLHPSNPFFPRAQFRHGSCVISIAYLEVPRPLTFVEVLTLAASAGQLAIPLAEEDVLHLWTVVRDAGERLVERCVDHQETGVEWNRLNILALPHAWYRVDVRSMDQLSRSSILLKVEQWSAMLPFSGGRHGQFRMADKFKTAFLTIV